MLKNEIVEVIDSTGNLIKPSPGSIVTRMLAAAPAGITMGLAAPVLEHEKIQATKEHEAQRMDNNLKIDLALINSMDKMSHDGYLTDDRFLAYMMAISSKRE